VLVVEDNEAVGQFSTDMLHDIGYKTAWASSAAEALDLLGDDAAAFDLVFSDVVMPGMKGVDFARMVKARFPDLPVILTSGYSDVLARQEHAGFELIQKPYSVQALSRALQIVLAGKRRSTG
jgi:CheY-like chemotaxis protein